jgi:DNA polymerase III gamma/tau subunit
VPAVDMPVPGAHVLQVAQASLPAATLKEPLAHAVHTRSDVAVAAALRYMPASHTALTDSQAAPSLVLENADPEAQASQTRSAVAEPVVSWPWPAAHMRHAAQELSPALAVKVPSVQSAHTRSLDAVALVASYLPAAHAAL